MQTISNEIEKIMNRRNISADTKKDLLLEMDATIYTNMGTDSTKQERSQAKKNSTEIYKAIYKIDPMEGFYYLYSKDK